MSSIQVSDLYTESDETLHVTKLRILMLDTLIEAMKDSSTISELSDKFRQKVREL